MRFSFIRSSKFLLALSVVMVIASIIVIIKPGPKLSIEFTGGTLLEMQLPEGKTKDDIEKSIASYTQDGKHFDHISITKTKTASYFVRLPELDNEQHLALLAHLQKDIPNIKEVRYNTIGPTLSASLKQKALTALSVASIMIVLYLAIAFRKMPRGLNPWKFGILAVIAFIHDVIITMGFFTVLGWFTTFEFDSLFVTALLTILAYSANDTIVIFDRIRGNIMQDGRTQDISGAVDRALHECITRTFHTLMGALIMLFAIFFMGSESIRWFILALIFGTVIGAYSSYFIASPLLVLWKTKKK